MDSRRALFKLVDAFRISPFLRLALSFVVSLVAALIVASLFTSCEKAILNADDIDDTEVADKDMGELYVTCSFSQTQSELRPCLCLIVRVGCSMLL